MEDTRNYMLFGLALCEKSIIEDEKVTFTSLCRLVGASPLFTGIRVRRDTGMWGGELLGLMRYCSCERKRSLSSEEKPRNAE